MRAYKGFHIIQSGGSHHKQDALFVETDVDGRGTLIQLVGNRRTGMRVECSAHMKLDDNAWDMLSKEHIGWVVEAKFENMRQVARMVVPPPRSQSWEYAENISGLIVRSMQEWTTVLIRRLMADGIMEKELGLGGYMDGGRYIPGNGISGSEGAGSRYLMAAGGEVEADVSEEE